MAKTKTSSAVKQRYNEKAYDRLAITVPKGAKQALEVAAKQADKSVNGYVNDAIAKQMGVPSLKEYSVLVTERENIYNPATGTIHDDEGLHALDGIHQETNEVLAFSEEDAIRKQQSEYIKNRSGNLTNGSVEFSVPSAK